MGLLIGIGLLKPGQRDRSGGFSTLIVRLFVGQVIFLLPALLIGAGIALAADYRKVRASTRCSGSAAS